MVKTYLLQTIHHAVDIGTTLTASWFRGHKQVYGNLTPKIFRKPYTKPVYSTLRSVAEVELGCINDFKRIAPALGDVPSEDDTLSWLFYMQHHGAPTRLLDWTENPLVALYFAVESDSVKTASSGRCFHTA